jgi:hypothetical protein
MSITTTTSDFFKKNPPIYWTPRLLAIIGIFFFSLMSMDVFVEDFDHWWEYGVAFFIHMIPTTIMIVALYIGWKNELYGSIIFNILGLITIFFFHTLDVDRIGNYFGFFLISFPFFVIAELFFYYWFTNRSRSSI